NENINTGRLGFREVQILIISFFVLVGCSPEDTSVAEELSKENNPVEKEVEDEKDEEDSSTVIDHWPLNTTKLNVVGMYLNDPCGNNVLCAGSLWHQIPGLTVGM